jgi:hypothetical protein
MKPAARIAAAAMVLGIALALGCSAQSEGEGLPSTASAYSTTDAGDGGLKDTANVLRGDGSGVDGDAALAELRRRKYAIATITIVRRTSVTDQVLGQKVEGSAEVHVLGPVKVHVEGKGDLQIGERLVLQTEDKKIIVAGAPETVTAALDALRAMCLAQRLKPMDMMPTGDAPSGDADECCVAVVEGVEEGR